MNIIKIKYTQGQFELAKSYYAYSLKLNPNNVRSLYGALLCTANLKSSLKAKDAGDNLKLSAWCKSQLEAKYQVSVVSTRSFSLLLLY